MDWAHCPWRGQSQSFDVAPEALAWRLCGSRLWAQKSENTNSAYEWRLGYGRPDVQPERELLGL